MIYRVFDVETIPDPDVAWQAPEADPNKFPPLCAHQVIAISVRDLELVPAVGGMRLQVGLAANLVGRDEDKLLSAFGSTCAAQKPVLVTWNGRKFDGPLLNVRAMKHKLNWAWWNGTSPNYRYRFGEAHLDLCDSLADYGGNGMKLSDAAKMFGLAGKTIMEGSAVAAEAAAGNLDKISRYCAADVAMTAIIFVWYQHTRGLVSRDDATAAVAALSKDL